MKRASLVFILNQNEELLLLKRTEKDVWQPGKWALPGGTSELGETAPETARREALEETALKVKDLELVDTLEYNRNGNDWRISYFVVGSYTGEAKIDFEHDDFKWASLKEIMQMETVPYLKDLIRKHFVVED